ncbi:hypothetical protein NL676_020307 [Syzygium grande]|nr:hypothetical protein NL676_020307 [Syzygium grande]
MRKSRRKLKSTIASLRNSRLRGFFIKATILCLSLVSRILSSSADTLHYARLKMSVVSAGTAKTENLDKNIGSLRLKLMENDLKEISGVIPIDKVSGSRRNEHYTCYSWKNENTPLRDGNFPA